MLSNFLLKLRALASSSLLPTKGVIWTFETNVQTLNKCKRMRIYDRNVVRFRETCPYWKFGYSPELNPIVHGGMGELLLIQHLKVSKKWMHLLTFGAKIGILMRRLVFGSLEKILSVTKQNRTTIFPPDHQIYILNLRVQ